MNCWRASIDSPPYALATSDAFLLLLLQSSRISLRLLYSDGNPARTPQMWFERMRHQLRYGFGKRIIKELNWLVKSKNTSETTKPILCKVRDYLNTHLEHIQYHQFKKLALPIGSGMVESACKWLIQQRFKEWECDGVRMDSITCYICD